MKSILLSAAVMLLAGTTSGLAQEQCSRGYLMCMDNCATRSSPQQDQCVMACQETNNSCSQAVYGQPVPSPLSDQDAQANDKANETANDRADETAPAQKKQSAKVAKQKKSPQ